MFAAPRIVDTSRDALYSNVIVVSDGTNEPFRWGNTSERPTRTGEGNGSMTQQSNPKDWIPSPQELRKMPVDDALDLCEAHGVSLASLLD